MANFPVFCGPTIVTRYIGATDHKPSRVIATCKRDSETTWRATVSYDDGPDNRFFPDDREKSAHYRAAEKILANDPFGQKMIVVSCGFDDNAYYWTLATEWQVRPILAALGACRAATDWARTPGDHGGINPYFHPFVKLAEFALGECDRKMQRADFRDRLNGYAQSDIFTPEG